MKGTGGSGRRGVLGFLRRLRRWRSAIQSDLQTFCILRIVLCLVLDGTAVLGVHKSPKLSRLVNKQKHIKHAT